MEEVGGVDHQNGLGWREAGRRVPLRLNATTSR